jgi:hypothetical protein
MLLPAGLGSRARRIEFAVTPELESDRADAAINGAVIAGEALTAPGGTLSPGYWENEFTIMFSGGTQPHPYQHSIDGRKGEFTERCTRPRAGYDGGIWNWSRIHPRDCMPQAKSSGITLVTSALSGPPTSSRIR